MARKVLRPALYQLAHGECVYCESALEVTATTEIEHYVAKTLDPGRAFEWVNLLPACSKCNNAKAECDHGNILLKPDEEDPEPFFWIHPDTGELQPHPTLDTAGQRRAIETIRICNLQRPALCTARTRMLRRVSRWLGHLAADEWSELVDPRTEYKLVLRHLLTVRGQAALADLDRQRFQTPAATA